MAFKTFTAGETLTASDVNTYLAKQAVIVCTSGTRPASPVDGMTIYQTDDDKLLVYDGTNWLVPDNLHGGTLGYAEITASQTGIGTTVTDITGLSVTVTVGAGRRIRITGHGQVAKTGGVGQATGLIREGSTQLGLYGTLNFETNGTVALFHGAVVLAPSSGSHTYKLSAQAGVNTMNAEASTTNIHYILVEDIGAA